MTEEKPIACSLGAGDLKDRLTEIEAIGADALISHSDDGRNHILRFRDEGDVRARLEQIVAAEAECCAFLDLDLRGKDSELVLSLSAPDGGTEVAKDLAVSFVRGRS